MPRSPAKSLTSTAASPLDTSLDPPRDAEFSLISIDPTTRKEHVIVEFHGFHNEATSSRMHVEVTRRQSDYWYAYWTKPIQSHLGNFYPHNHSGVEPEGSSLTAGPTVVRLNQRTYSPILRQDHLPETISVPCGKAARSATNTHDPTGGQFA